MIVVDDASDTPLTGPGVIRNDYRKGVAMAQNQIITALMDAWEEHEYKAWREFADATGLGWTVVGYGPEQCWAIRIT